MVNLAIIGCGSIVAWRHAPECAGNENINLCGFYDINRERVEEFALKYGGRAYGSYEEVLSDAKVDGVLICTANKYHCDLTVKAFAAGKHVLCEKPISVTEEEAEKMITAAEHSGKYLMVAHSQRMDAVNQLAKKLLKSESLGNVLSFRTTFGHRGPETWSVDKGNKTWFLNKNSAGLGSLGDIGIHKIDLIRWLLDDEIEYVTAKVSTLDKKDSGGNLIELDDNAICILETKKGIVGVLESSWIHYGKDNNTTTLYCSNGILEVDSNSETPIRVTMRNGSVKEFAPEPQDSQMARMFADCIANGEPPQIDGREGLRALRIALQCLKSSQRNERFKI